jgi:hypothetical protein
MQIIRAHRRAYTRRRDRIAFELFPAVVCLVCLLLHVEVTTAAAAALLTVSGLLGALLFGVMLQAAQRALDWADAAPRPSREVSAHARYMGQLAANSGYASLVCIAAAICYVFATVSDGPWLIVASAISIGLSVHLVLVLLLVIRRVYAVTEQRLTRARTGADIEDDLQAS